MVDKPLDDLIKSLVSDDNVLLAALVTVLWKPVNALVQSGFRFLEKKLKRIEEEDEVELKMKKIAAEAADQWVQQSKITSSGGRKKSEKSEGSK